MKVLPFKAAHSECFILNAQAEGWITDQREIEFLLAAYPDGCLVFVAEDKPVAFITAIRYARSAWIGNLLVLPAYRQQGIGRALMEKALNRLDRSGCETVWLTASADGAHLYRTLGFKQIDRVQRWRGFGGKGLQGGRPVIAATMATIDCLGWGDSRSALLDSFPENSSSVTAPDGFMVHSPCADGWQIGPWGAVTGEAAAILLDAAMGNEISSGWIFLDVPVKNLVAGELLSARGFSVSGNTLLMYRGRVPQYRAEYVYSLASMGSYG